MPMHKEWVDLQLSSVAVGTGASMVPLNVLADMRVEVNKTVARLIVGLDLHHQDIDTNESGSARMSLGVGVATQEGFDGGALTVPNPANSSEFPIHGWLWRAQYVCEFSNSATFGIEVNRFPRIDADLRASRKVDKGVLYLAAFNGAQNGSIDIQITGVVRALMLTG